MIRIALCWISRCPLAGVSQGVLHPGTLHCSLSALRTETTNRWPGRGESGCCWSDNVVLNMASARWWSSEYFPAFWDVQFLREGTLHLADLEGLSSYELLQLGFQSIQMLNLHSVFLWGVPQVNHTLWEGPLLSGCLEPENCLFHSIQFSYWEGKKIPNSYVFPVCLPRSDRPLPCLFWPSSLLGSDESESLYQLLITTALVTMPGPPQPAAAHNESPSWCL